MTAYIIPFLIFSLLIFATIKKINIYETFCNGAKKSISLVCSIFPYIATIMIAIALFRVSGLGSFFVQALSPLFNFLGIPTQVCELVLLRPFTGSGSLSILKDVIATYGADSYITRCACTILGSSETVFYVTAVYFAGTKTKKVWLAISISLFCNFISAILSCFLCKII